MGRPAAVEITGLKKVQKGLKEIPEAIDDLKAVHHRVGVLVLGAAQARMPVRSGALKGSYKAGNIKGGAKIGSSLIYAGVSEFGGTIPRRASVVRTKHKRTASAAGLKSYYTYPAAEEKRDEIVRIYEEEIPKLARKYLD